LSQVQRICSYCTCSWLRLSRFTTKCVGLHLKTKPSNPYKCSIQHPLLNPDKFAKWKNVLKVGKSQFFFCKSIRKNVHLWMAKLTPHTWVSFLGQTNMHNYSSWYILTHTIILKGNQFFKKNIIELPLTLIIKEPPWTAKAKNSNSKNLHRTFDNRYIGEQWIDVDYPFFKCLPISP